MFSDEVDPYENDEIREEMNRFPEDLSGMLEPEPEPGQEEFGSTNGYLNEVLDFYDCADLLPYANYILWLASLKEAIGYIPPDFNLSYMDMRCLVVLREESGKKMMHDALEAREASRKSGSSSVPISHAVKG